MLRRWLPRSRLVRAIGLLIALAAGCWYGAPWLLPLPPGLQSPPAPGAIYLSADGTPLRHLLNADGQRVAVPLTFGEIPDDFVHAMLAAEDKRFFSHGGVDLLAIVRAAWDGLRAGRVTSGASTITQQLLKVSGPKATRTIGTKLRESLLARQLEMRWSKQQILAAYVNRVSFGNLFVGAESAAQGYFHRPLRSLTIAEMAFLAALPQAPTRMNPFRDPSAALARQQAIIQKMRALGWLDKERAELALEQRVKLERFRGGFTAPHAIALLQSQTAATAGPVRTTIDAALQKRVEEIIAYKLDGLRDKHVEHAAAVVIENATGHVLALAGSRDYFAPTGGQINGAWEPRSPGSSVKPFTYALAFQRGMTPASIVPDLPLELQTSTGLYRPENYDHKLYGPMTCRQALGSSLNISAVRVLRQSGGPEKLKSLLEQLGISTLTESADHYGLGLTIGNAPVRLLELANAYATLARLGLHQPWSLLPGDQAKPVRILEADACWWIADILSDNQARVLTFGPRSPLRLPFAVAAKTGTSTNYRDNWTLGYTPEYTVGVWAGNFEGQPMEGVSGVTGAGPIFHDIFMAVHGLHPTTWYAVPDRIVRARIDPRIGKRVNPRLPPPLMSREEKFFGDRLPPVAMPSDYDKATGRALLPPEYADWVRSRDNWLGDSVMSVDTRGMPMLRITAPADGLIVRLNPDVPGDQRLILRALPDDDVQWSSTTLAIRREGRTTFALPVPGPHQITARRAGQEHTVTIRVEAP